MYPNCRYSLPPFVSFERKIFFYLVEQTYAQRYNDIIDPLFTLEGSMDVQVRLENSARKKSMENQPRRRSV